MSDPVSTIRNVGPRMEAAFRKVGIDTADQLRDLGADAAYARLIANGHRPHFIGYYVLVMGLQGRPWNDCQGAEKDALRRRFDQLKQTNVASPENAISTLEAELDRIGVRLKR